jgi:hypothetical protein
MKNTELSSIRTCALAAAIILLVSLPTTSLTQTTGDQKAAAAGEWKTVEEPQDAEPCPATMLSFCPGREPTLRTPLLFPVRTARQTA